MRTFATVSLLIAAASADAEADAWSVASKVIPGGMAAVGGLDIGALRGTALDPLLTKAADGVFDHAPRELSEKCGIDVMSRVKTVAFAVDNDGTGAAYIELRASGDEIVACMRKMLAGESGISVSQRGNKIVADEGSRAEVTLGWVDGVLIIPLHHGRLGERERGAKALNLMMTGPGVAKDAILIRGLRDVSTSATAWGIWGERMEWDGRELDKPRRSSALTSRTLVAQSAPLEEDMPTPAVPPAEGDYEERGERDDRHAPMLYCTGTFSGGSRPKLKLSAFFKSDADWVRTGVEKLIQKEGRELGEAGTNAKVTSANNRVIVTTELSSMAALISLFESL